MAADFEEPGRDDGKRVQPWHRDRRFRRVLAVSLTVHVVFSLMAILSVIRSGVPPVVQAQKETKFYPAELFLPGGSRAKQTREPAGRKKHVTPQKSDTSNLAMSAHPAPQKGAPVAAPHDPVAGDGTDAQSAEPAFPVFSPRPVVTDRALLPSAEQQVVVDVKVSAVGEVLEATLVKGIGNALDQIVLETVKTWRFHPATINGNAVATESELIFPFNRSYPTNPA